jgi:thioredoxin 1
MITVKKFSAGWCGPCRALAPVFEKEIKPMFSGRVNFEEIDVDNNPEEVIKYNVTSVPTVILERDGSLLEKYSGANSKYTYINALNEHIK